MNSLAGVLLRFRKKPVPIVADIEAIFYQVKVANKDKDALRFFLWPEGNLTTET